MVRERVHRQEGMAVLPNHRLGWPRLRVRGGARNGRNSDCAGSEVEPAHSNCGARLRLHVGFVGRGAVETGDGNVVEAQVHAQLGAVVDHVVHDHAANDGDARHGEDGLARSEQ